MIGASCCFRDDLKIGDDSVVGVGCVVMRNLKSDHMLVYGFHKPIKL